MQLQPTKLSGLYLIELKPHLDERGFFARSFCRKVFAEHGISFAIQQSNISQNRKKGTLRGMHYQIAPAAEAKLVRCTRGAIFDVAVDIRPDSPTFGQWFGTELTADNHRSLFIPEGFAHGFQTLVDETEVFYEMGVDYQAPYQRGLCWADPDVRIEWPLADPIVNERDRQHPRLRELKA